MSGEHAHDIDWGVLVPIPTEDLRGLIEELEPNSETITALLVIRW